MVGGSFTDLAFMVLEIICCWFKKKFAMCKRSFSSICLWRLWFFQHVTPSKHVPWMNPMVERYPYLSIPKTKSKSIWKWMGGRWSGFLLERPIFKCYVSFREAIWRDSSLRMVQAGKFRAVFDLWQNLAPTPLKIQAHFLGFVGKLTVIATLLSRTVSTLAQLG